MSDAGTLTKAEIYNLLLDGLGDQFDVRWDHGFNPKFIAVNLGPSNFTVLVEPVGDKVSVMCNCWNHETFVVDVDKMLEAVLYFVDHEGVPWPG